MNREKYLERVLDMIIRDSQVEGKYIIYPFSLPLYSLQTNFYLPLHENFLTYCRDQYGLSEEECKDIWYDYTMTMVKTVDFEDYVDYSRTPDLPDVFLNEVYLFGNLEPQERDVKESLRLYGFNSEGQYKFFMRVYNRIIDSIEIKHFGNDNHNVLYINEFRRTRDGLFGLRLLTEDGDPDKDFITFSISYTEYIFRCSLELLTEGLPDGGQFLTITLSDMILEYIYKNVFQNKIFQRGISVNGINESDERMDRFVGKVLQFLIDDTYYIEDNTIHLPFTNKTVSIHYTNTYTEWTILDVITYIEEPPKSFTKYCVDTYGLDSESISLVWVKYRVFLMENFLRLTKRY